MKQILLLVIAAFISSCSTAPRAGDRGLAATGLPPSGNLDTFFSADIDSDDYILLGERHASVNHKQVFEIILRALLAKQKLNAIAIEAVDGAENQMFQAYLADPAATAGSRAEEAFLEHVAAFGFPEVKHESYRRIFRLLKEAAAQGVHVCGFNFDDLTTHPNNMYSIYKDSAVQNQRSFADLPLEYRTLASKVYGPAVSKHALARKPKPAEGILPEIRELWMTANLESCLRGEKKALVFSGHAHVNSLRPYFTTMADLLRLRMPQKRIAAAEIATFNPSNFTASGMSSANYSEGASWRAPEFQRESHTDKFEAVDLRKTGVSPTLRHSLFIKGRATVLPGDKVVDILIFGPPSESIP